MDWCLSASATACLYCPCLCVHGIPLLPLLDAALPAAGPAGHTAAEAVAAAAAAHDSAASTSAGVAWLVRLSLLVNVCLLFAKMYAFALSRSAAVLASLADSVVDIASQVRRLGGSGAGAAGGVARGQLPQCALG